ncbi:MAG: S8 family serine peptidase, partial [Armatimonadetes bacterium]|nr:S8 family serine peptidase [Armatimonadota bacterium]
MPRALGLLSGVPEPLGPQGVWIVRCPSGVREEALAAQLRRQPGVLAAEPDALFQVQARPNDASYPQQWHLPKVGSEEAWDLSKGSPSVLVAVLDTGVDRSHPDFAGKLEPGRNVLNEAAAPLDDNGHGTAVAGVVAAATDNGIGIASLGWSCRILPVKVADSSGWASSSSIYLGLVWAADHGAKVANLSFRVSDNTFASLGMQYFASKGGVVTVSAGNQGDVSSSPDNPYCLTVGATDSSDQVASWSTRGTIVDLTAPGDRILTTNRGGGYGVWSGTSFSAPLAAAAVALAFSAKPELTPEQAMLAVKDSAKDLGPAGWDPAYGQGRRDAASALWSILGGEPKDETP